MAVGKWPPVKNAAVRVAISESQPCFETTLDAASTALGSSDSTPTTPPTGSVSVSMTDGVDIRVIANSTSGDFRAVASGTLDGAGDSGSAATDDIYGTTRDASNPTLGCYELVAAAAGQPTMRRWGGIPGMVNNGINGWN